MTMTARCTVKEISDGSPIEVLLVANTTDVVEPYPGGGNVPAIYSNTEGKVRSVEVRLTLDEDSTSLEVGQVVTFSGHFDNAKPQVG